MTSSPASADRSAFQLPDFTRFSWVGDKAREVWEPRQRRIIQVWSHLEWLSIHAGLRACALVRISLPAYVAGAPAWASYGLSSLPLREEAANDQPYVNRVAAPKPGEKTILRVVIGRLEDLQKFNKAWQAQDDDEIGALLGYPPCCRAFFRQTWTQQRLLDTTWPMAVNTGSQETNAGVLEVSGSPMANSLWRWMGVRAVPHLPCRFDCPGTIELGERFLAAGVHFRLGVEMKWIAEILSWPVEWSSLHGIAEVKTPIMRVSTRTDVTAAKRIVRWKGFSYPEEGARGLTFPYQTPPRPLVTASSGFQRGLQHVAKAPPIRPKWFHEDNGFSSAHAMETNHRTLVTLAREELSGIAGNVLDLGCGNAALLQKICVDGDSLIPFGVDVKDQSLLHAHEILPEYAANFFRANIFDPALWPEDRRYALAILMVGRLLEGARTDADRLLHSVAERCERLLIYAYPGWSTEDLTTLAARAGLRLLRSSAGIAAMVSLAELRTGTPDEV